MTPPASAKAVQPAFRTRDTVPSSSLDRTVGILNQMTSDSHDPGPDAARTRAERVADPDSAAAPFVRPGGATIRIGTASWTDPTLTATGVFYPAGARTPEERLRYYASRFPLVEVDSAYYALPSKRVAALWVERTPATFTINLKAFSLMTGQPAQMRVLPPAIRDALPATVRGQARVYPKDVPEVLLDAIWREYLDAIEPLRSSGRLGAVLLQYPRWFVPSAAHADALVAAAVRLAEADVRCAVELRHHRWFGEAQHRTERTLRFLREREIPFVMVDGPQGLGSSVPGVAAVTSPALAMVRLHGRNAATWEARGIPTVERYRYLYGAAELEDWARKIAGVADDARETHVVFNNCYANYGTTNALEFGEVLRRVLT
jgi:uncharacterized protein YecE (DUF72 family)